MQILTCPAQLQRLEGILRKSLPLALPVFGAVLNINRGNPGQFEVLVDKWPEFGAVLARPSGEVAMGTWGHCRGGVTRCPGTRQACSEHPWWEVLGWDLGVLGGTGELHCWVPWEQGPGGHCGHWEALQPAPGVRVGSLQPSHVDLLNDTWPYGGNA
ncbi:GLYL3 protein, partial [Dryoscopus gambensis]|nr:GLYL3 protein [Dryoscopus gambensis]